MFLLLAGAALRAAGPVYVVLWFDTEDYVEPAADDAALHIARDLTSLGVRATFKVVGEKARVLEQRGRWDVVRALALHDVGYHSNTHSGQPTPALYLRDLGFLEGVEEFARREGPGERDLERIFGVHPSCYGQPGSSWGPQSNPALRRMGIPVYLDEGSQVGLDDQPFWYGGVLHIFNMGRYQMRAALDGSESVKQACARFDGAAAELASREGGGVISIYYHPTEFVTTEFWDGVNFAKGANPERGDWRRPHRRSEADTERCYGILHDYVAHARGVPGVRFATAREMLQLYGGPEPPHFDRARIARHLAARQTFLMTGRGALSAADMLQVLLGMEPEVIDGPATRIASDYRAAAVPRPAFERAKADAASFIRTNKRLPAEVWIGSEKLSTGDFAATLAADNGGAEVSVRRANLEFEKYFSNEPAKSFAWPIHPEGFRAPELLELGKLQGWTLKPARLR